MRIANVIIAKFSTYPVFSYRDVRLSFPGSVKDASLFRALSYLKAKGKLFAVAKGRYTMSSDSAVSGFAFAPFYYGLLYAMSLREMWTQNSRPEIVTLKAVRKGKVHTFNDRRNLVSLHHSTPKHFFGFETLRYGKFSVPVSDPEKTLIDLFYYKVRLPIQSYSALLQAVRVARVKKYLVAYDDHTRAAVGNFIGRYKRLADQGRLKSKY